MAVTAVVPGYVTTGDVAVTTASRQGFIALADGAVGVFDLATLEKVGTLDPHADTVLAISTARGGEEPYAVTGRPNPMDQNSTDVFIERLFPAPRISSQLIDTVPLPVFQINLILVIPPVSAAGADTAYVSIRTDVPGEGSRLFTIGPLDSMPSASVTRLSPTSTLPIYFQFALSPVPGENRIYAIHGSGIDSIDLVTNAITPNALPSNGGITLVAGKVAPGVYKAYLGKDNTIYEATLPNPSGFTTFVPARAVQRLTLSADGNVLLATLKQPQELLVAKTATGQTRTDSLGGNENMLFVATFNPDATEALVANPATHALDVVQIRSGRLLTQATNLRITVGSLPNSAFQNPNKRAQLIALVRDVEDLIARADGAPTPAIRNALLTTARALLRQTVMPRMDGCSGGGPNNDWITDCTFQVPVLMAAQELQAQIESALPEPQIDHFPPGNPQPIP